MEKKTYELVSVKLCNCTAAEKEALAAIRRWTWQLYRNKGCSPEQIIVNTLRYTDDHKNTREKTVICIVDEHCGSNLVAIEKSPCHITLEDVLVHYKRINAGSTDQ